MNTSHRITGASAQEIRKYLKENYGLDEGEDIFYLAQILAFLVHDTSVEKISFALKSQRNRFAIRKLQAVLSLLNKVFSI